MNGVTQTPETIFGEAIEISSRQDRSLFLDRACKGNADLRHDVERLVEDHFRAGSFLELPAMEEQQTVLLKPIAEGPGTVIGPYKLLQQIGEGGMGVVFMAEQTEPLQRTVALKIIKPGMDTRQVIARFEAERQAVAMMDHPNIAKVLDAGTTDSGRPYFVMELVKGVPITKYCDEKHLPLRARLELFVAVCQAVQHAHQKGIIHRDIKPTNVLVAEYDNRAVPKVIDFGVAKATAQRLTERTMFTEFGQVLGTMEYMSPEQSKFNQLDIDTRSDIYSLGVLLYELLAGSTPFEGKRLHAAAFDEMLRIIREEEPPKPSTRLSSLSSRERAIDSLPLAGRAGEGVPTTLASIAANRHTEPARLSKDVRGELDWIVMKALEKDRNRRYETASNFAADIERHLHDEPVEAGPPSATYRFRKFARRNKGPVAAASLILLTLVVGMLGTTMGLIRAEKARRAEAEQRKTAEAREAESRAILDFVQSKVFAAAGPKGQEGGLGREVTLRKAVEAALPFVETSFVNQPSIEAQLRMTLGLAFLNLGEADKAAEQFQKARMLFSQCRGPDHPDTLRSMGNLATSYSKLGRHVDALKLREETLAMQKAKLGPNHPDTLLAMNNLANSYSRLGRYADALKLREETLALKKAKLGPDHPDTIITMHNLANSYHDLGRYADSLKLFEETLTVRKAKLGPDHPDTLSSMTGLANSYSDLGRYTDALQLQEETLALMIDKLGPDHPDTLMAMNNLSKSHFDLGRFADALKLNEETLALRKAKLGPDHPNTLSSMGNLATSYSTLGRHEDALKLREETLALQRAKLGLDHPDTLTTMNNLANSYDALGRFADALKLNVETLALQKAKRGPDHPNTLLNIQNLATSYYKLGRHAESLKLYEETLALQNAKLGRDHPHTILTMNNLANSYSRLGRHADALKLREETLSLFKAKLGPDHPDTISSMVGLANSYALFGRHVEALKFREETLALQNAKLGPDHPYTLLTMNNLANSYHDLGRYADALKLHEETLALRKATLGPDHPDTLSSMGNVAMSYLDLGRHAESLKLYEETLALKRAKLGPDHPNTLSTLSNLATSYSKLGRHVDALKLHEETLALRTVKLGPDHPNTLQTMWHVASSLVDLDRSAEAAPFIDECLKRAEGKIVHQKLIGGLIKLRVRHFQTTKDAAGCRATAEMYEKLERTDAGSLYDVACLRAVTAAVIERDPKSPDADASQLAREEADRAMAWLKQAVAAGFSNVQRMLQDADLDALRDREDFQKLVAELEAESDEKELMKNESEAKNQEAAKTPN